MRWLFEIFLHPQEKARRAAAKAQREWQRLRDQISEIAATSDEIECISCVSSEIAADDYITVGFVKVRNDPSWTPEEREKVRQWAEGAHKALNSRMSEMAIEMAVFGSVAIEMATPTAPEAASAPASPSTDAPDTDSQQ